MRSRGRGRSMARIPPIVAAGPLVIMTTRSDKSTASSTSCVTMSTVLPVAATMRISSSCSRARVRASSAPNGSSSSRTLGSIESARAMPTRCFMPPEISCGYLCWACPSCTSSRARRTRSLTAAFFSAAPNTRSTASWTFSKQVSQGSREWFWNTTPRSGPGPVTSRSASRTWPSVGLRSPATMLSSVDSPARMSRLISSSAQNGPFFVSNTLRTLSICKYLSVIPCSLVAEAAGEEDHQLFEREADDADREDGDDDVLHVEVVPFVPYPEADADAAGEHLRGDDHQPRHADRQAHARDHVRKHGREKDLPEHRPLRKVEDPRDVEIVLRDVAHADRGVDDHRPQGADEDDVDRGGVGGLEHHQADRQPGERRHRLQDADDRRRHVGEEAKTPEHETERDADERRHPETDADPAERGEHVPAYALVVRPLLVEGTAEDPERRMPGRRGSGQTAAGLCDDRPKRHEQRQADDRSQHARQPIGRLGADVQRRLGRGARLVHRRTRLRRLLGRPDLGERRLQRTHGGTHQATLILNEPAYRFGSLPSHTTPSISLALRMGSLGKLVFVITAASL